MQLTLQSVRNRREEILQVANLHGAHNVRIFGSVARGESHRASDLDVLVRFEKGRSLYDLVGVRQDLEDLLGCKVDVVSERALKEGDEILLEAVAL